MHRIPRRICHSPIPQTRIAYNSWRLLSYPIGNFNAKITAEATLVNSAMSKYKGERSINMAMPGITPSFREKGLRLVEAADKGDMAEARRLLNDGAYIHAQDKNGRCALVAAAYRNDIEMSKLLIGYGADVNMQDDTLQSAYLIAASDGFAELLRITLDAGADVYSTDSYNGTGLIRAADRGHAEVIAELLKTGIRVDHINKLGWTALLEAIILGDGGARHTEVVGLLIDAGADVNLADRSGVSPLAHAQDKGFANIAEVLAKAGAKR